MEIKYIGPIVVEMHEEVLFAPGHAVHRWATALGAEDTRNIQRVAPMNKRTAKFPSAPPRGHLKRNIVGSTKRIGPEQIEIITESKASYSIFVIGGTNTQFARGSGGRFATNRQGFPLPTNNFGPYKRVQRIRGQAANNFMMRGRARTAARHESLRGTSIRRWT